MILLLAIMLIALLSISFLLAKGDVFNPSVLYTGGFLIAVVAASLNIKTWGVDLSGKTLFVIVLGCAGFLFGALPFTFSRGTVLPKPEEFSPMIISIWKTLLISTFGAFLLIWLYRDVRSISFNAASYYQNLGTMTAFKNALGEGYNLNESLEQLLKISTVSAYVYTFVVIYNLCIPGKKKKINFVMLIPILIYIAQTMLRGGRGGLITLAIGGLFTWYFFSKKMRGQSLTIDSRTTIRVVLALILVVILFYYTKGMVGRVSSESVFAYSTRYFGGSIELLDLYVKQPFSKATGFGGESLTGLVNSLSKIGLVTDSGSVSLEFRDSVTGVALGNVYSELRRAYNDFGYVGVFVFPMILSFIFNGLYSYLRRTPEQSTWFKFVFILYMSLIGIIPMQAMEDQFFISKLSIGFGVQVFLLYLLTLIIIKYQFVWNSKKEEYLL